MNEQDATQVVKAVRELAFEAMRNGRHVNEFTVELMLAWALNLEEMASNLLNARNFIERQQEEIYEIVSSRDRVTNAVCELTVTAGKLSDELDVEKLKAEWYNDLLDMCVELANNLEDQLNRSWILVSDRMPARGEVVEVTVKDGNDRYTCEAYIHAISGRWSHSAGCGASVDGKVIAWRPKSEPYQGEE